MLKGAVLERQKWILWEWKHWTKLKSWWKSQWGEHQAEKLLRQTSTEVIDRMESILIICWMLFWTYFEEKEIARKNQNKMPDIIGFEATRNCPDSNIFSMKFTILFYPISNLWKTVKLPWERYYLMQRRVTRKGQLASFQQPSLGLHLFPQLMVKSGLAGSAMPLSTHKTAIRCLCVLRG